jgi:predicted site-specific integrase-resolvase
MQNYSTEQAAKLVGIHPITLHKWLHAGKVRPSHSLAMSGRTLWRWTSKDVERVRKYKAAHYRKGRGRKREKK